MSEDIACTLGWSLKGGIYDIVEISYKFQKLSIAFTCDSYIS